MSDHNKLTKHLRFGADPVHIGDDQSVTPVKMHGVAPSDAIDGAAIDKTIAPNTQRERVI